MPLTFLNRINCSDQDLRTPRKHSPRNRGPRYSSTSPLALFFCRPYGTLSFSSPTQDLRPGLSSIAPFGAGFSRGLIHLLPRLHPCARSTRPGIALSQSSLRRQSSFRIARTLAETLLEKSQSFDASSKNLLLDTEATPEIRTRFL